MLALGLGASRAGLVGALLEVESAVLVGLTSQAGISGVNRVGCQGERYRAVGAVVPERSEPRVVGGPVGPAGRAGSASSAMTREGRNDEQELATGVVGGKRPAGDSYSLEEPPARRHPPQVAVSRAAGGVCMGLGAGGHPRRRYHAALAVLAAVEVELAEAGQVAGGDVEVCASSERGPMV
jgi:hypothetical protein